LTSTEQVIEALGGNREVIELTGATPQTVSNWKSATGFPPYTYELMQGRLRRVKKRAPGSLWGMQKARRHRASRAAK
jgi:hypothetical protein